MLVFYPWAFSGICTSELAGLQARAGDLVSLGVRLLAISCDAMFTLRAYADAEHWTRMSILNVARMGRFSSDRAILEYCRDIWRVGPQPIELC